MTIFPVPGWAYFSISPITLPEVYWNAVSAEQRIKMLCEDLWKLVRQVDLIVQGLNELDDRLTIAEEKIEQILVRLGEITDELAIITGRLDVIDGQILALEGDIQRIDLVLTQHATDIANIVSDIGDINGQLTIINQAIQDLPTTIQDQIDLYVQTSTFETIINNLVEADLSGKIDVIDPAVAGRIPLIDAAGQLEDSGYTPADFLAGGGGGDGIPPVDPATAGNYPALTAAGALTDSGTKPADFVTKVPEATVGHLASLTADGGIADSGIAIEDLPTDVIPAVDPAVAGNFPMLTATGQLEDSATNANYFMRSALTVPSVDSVAILTPQRRITHSNAVITSPPSSDSAANSNNFPSINVMRGILTRQVTPTGALSNFLRMTKTLVATNFATGFPLTVQGKAMTARVISLTGPDSAESLDSASTWRTVAHDAAGNRYDLVATTASSGTGLTVANLPWQIANNLLFEETTESAAIAKSLDVPNSIVYIAEED